MYEVKVLPLLDRYMKRLTAFLLLCILALNAGCGGGTSGTRIERTLSGFVQDPQGTPVSGVVITDGINTAESDAHGNFFLIVAQAGESVEIGVAAANTVEPVFTDTVTFGDKDNIRVKIELRNDGITITPVDTPQQSKDPIVQPGDEHDKAAPGGNKKDGGEKENSDENNSIPEDKSPLPNPTPNCELDNSCPLPPQVEAATYEVQGVLTDGLGLGSGVQLEINIQYLSSGQIAQVITNTEGEFTWTFELPPRVSSSEVNRITITFYSAGKLYGPFDVPVEEQQNRYHFTWQGEADKREIVFFDGVVPLPTDARPENTEPLPLDPNGSGASSADAPALNKP